MLRPDSSRAGCCPVQPPPSSVRRQAAAGQERLLVGCGGARHRPRLGARPPPSAMGGCVTAPWWRRCMWARAPCCSWRAPVRVIDAHNFPRRPGRTAQNGQRTTDGMRKTGSDGRRKTNDTQRNTIAGRYTRTTAQRRPADDRPATPMVDDPRPPSGPLRCPGAAPGSGRPQRPTTCDHKDSRPWGCRKRAGGHVQANGGQKRCAGSRVPPHPRRQQFDLGVQGHRSSAPAHSSWRTSAHLVQNCPHGRVLQKNIPSGCLL